MSALSGESMVDLVPIEAHERTIGRIFSDDYAFEIPAYQRPYAWEEEQVRELLSDLLTAMDNQDTSGGVYFLGSIVLIKTPNDAHSQVIDGQQRLTTITILLSVLRDLTTDLEKKIDRRAYIFQKANADRGTNERFRLLLRGSDRPFFLRTIQQPDATDGLPDPAPLQGSQFRIAANAHYLRGQLQQFDEGRRDALIAFIVQRCYLVVVAVPTANAARRIFTVLNARGLDLTATDILKADLLERAGADREGSLAARWEAAEAALGRERFVELFGHIRMIYERDKPRLSLEAGFSQFVAPFQGDADHFVSDILEPLADAYRLLEDDKELRKQFGSEVAKAVRSLARIDNKDWVAPALLRLWKRRPGDAEEVGAFLTRLERVAYFLFVTRTGVNDRIARFAGVMDEFEPRPDRQTPGADLTDLEQAAFLEGLDGPIYLSTRVCKPVLQRLDEALSTGGASYDELVSIEHVLPQTVDDQSEWAGLFPETSQRTYWTHKLGNLVLLTHRVNTRASNWDFDRKKREYFSSADGSSPFVITQDVLRTEKWTPEHLLERQNKLVTRLADVWRLDITKIMQFLTESDEGREFDAEVAESRGFTDTKLIRAKRQTVMRAFGTKIGTSFGKSNGARYSNPDGTCRAVCAVSKRYVTGAAYWYGYSPEWDAFLSSAKDSFLILSCMDRDVAYAIPKNRIAAILDNLHRTPGRHWHIMLEDDEMMGLTLVIPLSDSNLRLEQFTLPLGRDEP